MASAAMPQVRGARDSGSGVPRKWRCSRATWMASSWVPRLWRNWNAAAMPPRSRHLCAPREPGSVLAIELREAVRLAANRRVEDQLRMVVGRIAQTVPALLEHEAMAR